MCGPWRHGGRPPPCDANCSRHFYNAAPGAVFALNTAPPPHSLLHGRTQNRGRAGQHYKHYNMPSSCCKCWLSPRACWGAGVRVWWAALIPARSCGRGKTMHCTALHCTALHCTALRGAAPIPVSLGSRLWQVPGQRGNPECQVVKPFPVNQPTVDRTLYPALPSALTAGAGKRAFCGRASSSPP
jgi:hypothetical protein